MTAVEVGRTGASAWVLHALSVGKYLSNSFHSMEASPLHAFLQTLSILIFTFISVYFPSIF